MLYLMFEYTVVLREGMNPLQSVIYWFAEPRRIVFHVVARVVRAVCTPLLSLFLGIIVKRIMGLQRPGDAKQYSEYQRLRRWINDKLVGQGAIKKATAVLGTHYQTVSIIFRMLGAKVSLLPSSWVRLSADMISRSVTVSTGLVRASTAPTPSCSRLAMTSSLALGLSSSPRTSTGLGRSLLRTEVR